MNKNKKTRIKLAEIKRVLAPVTVVVLAVLAFVQIYFSFFVFRQTNDECLWKPHYRSLDSLQIVFGEVKPGGVTWNAGIRDGDTLVAFEGEFINSFRQLTKKLAQKKEGETAFYQVKRGDSLFIAPVTVKKLLPIRSLTFELFGLIWLIVGFIVYSSKPDGEVQNKFYNIGILWTLSNNAVFADSSQYLINVNETFIQFLNWTWVLASAFLPPAILSFFLTFPEKKNFAKKKIAKILYYGYPAAIIVFYISGVFFIEPPNKDLVNLGEMIVHGITSVSVAITLILGFFSLLISFRKITDEKKKKPLRIIVYAYAISLLSMIYVYFIALAWVGSLYTHPYYYLPMVLYLLLPVAFGYTIFKYSFMDASAVVKNAFLYFIASLFIAGIYFFSIVIIGGSFIRAVEPVYQGLIIGLLFVLFVILFQSTKDKFQEAITKRFYPEQLAFKEALIKFSREIPSVLSFDSVLDETARIFSDALKIKVFAIALKEDDSDKLIVKRSAGLKNDGFALVPKSVPKEKETRYVEAENFEKIFENHELLLENEIQTALPLIMRGKLIGFVLLGVKHSGARFSPEDISVLSAAANQVAVALENARMYEAEKKEIILRRDLEKARMIQRGLLPREMPELPRAEIFGEMLPAQWVGGDYFDVIPIDENRFYAVIGDVSGKGFAAAFYMSKLQTMIRLLADEKLSPAELLKTLNAKIYGALEKNYFITLSIVLFDFKKDTAYYSRAGHTPLKVCRRETTKNYLPKGIAVGLDGGKLFDENTEETEIPFEKGDIFVLYSDGVSEEMNPQGKLIGDDFMDDVLKNSADLPLNKIWRKIIEKLENFQNGNEQHDDITFLLIKIK